MIQVTKKFLILFIVILFCGIIAGQILIYNISNDFKNVLIRRDYHVAGYLSRNDPDESGIASAFTREKATRDFLAGKRLLERAGYGHDVDMDLIPEFRILNQKYTGFMLLLFISLAAVIITLFLNFVLR